MAKILRHEPVLLEEVLEGLGIVPGGCYVDATLGGGGHAEGILERIGDRGFLVGIDQDLQALEFAKERLKRFQNQTKFVHQNFSRIQEILAEHKIASIDGIFVDLGVSSFQFDQSERGFSFSQNGPLDMRMDPSNEALFTAADLLRECSEKELADLFYEWGEERQSRRVARALAHAREKQPIETTVQLAEIVASVFPKRFHKIHPATRVFQALRIAVNHEMEHLERFLSLDFSFLKTGGRVAVISFHSLEDRPVKHRFRARKDFRAVYKKPLAPRKEEILKNPRSRSAKLRVFEKI